MGNSQPLLIAIITPLVTWCLALVSAGVAQRRAEKNSTRSYEAEIKKIGDNVEFIKTWWRAYREVSQPVTTGAAPTQAVAVDRLEQALQAFSVQQLLHARQSGQPRRSPWIKPIKWVLLLGHVRTWPGRVLQVLYLLLSVSTITFAILFTSEMIKSAGGIVGNIATALAFDALGMLPLLGLCWLIAAVDHWLAGLTRRRSVTGSGGVASWPPHPEVAQPAATPNLQVPAAIRPPAPQP